MAKSRRPIVVLLAATVALLGSARCWAESEEPGDAASREEQIARGGVTYRVHCLNCHGEDGRGEGPMAELLKVAPIDLTRLSRRDGGEFPAQRLVRTIDGRDEVRGHGPRGMPIWGIGFQDLGRDSDQEAEVRAKILNLVAYIESIQARVEND